MPCAADEDPERPRRDPDPDSQRALPELFWLTELEVRLPRMQVVTLERLAAVGAETVDAVLTCELRDLVSVHADWLSREVPGFAEALAWPEATLAAQR